MTNNINKFKGLGVALITPFKASGAIDFKALETLVNNLIDNHVDYLLALGTTSEAPTLSHNERLDVLRCITDVNNGRLPILMGLGGPNTLGLAKELQAVEKLPVDAILSVTPYYNKPSQNGLIEHYKLISIHSPKPILLYNVPGRTACNLEAETTLRIAAACPNVIGIKEASGNMKQIMHLLHHKPDKFLVISGDDLLTLPLMAAGLDGLISVIANAYPAEVSNMVNLAMNDQFIKARLYHDKLYELMVDCFREGNPSGIKAIMSLQGKIGNNLRLPSVPVSDKLMETIKSLI